MITNKSKPTLTSLSQNHLKKLCSLKIKKYRTIENAFLIEGLYLCTEALSYHKQIKEVIVTKETLTRQKGETIYQKLNQLDTPIFMATAAQFKTLSSTEHPQGIAMVMIPSNEQLELNEQFILGIDHIQDPGNMGTLLRSAEWFGVKSVFVNNGTVDIYNPKVVRSTMGAIFRLNIKDVNFNEQIPLLKQRSYRIVGASSQRSVPIYELKPTEKDLLIIGNEAGGISESILSLLDIQVQIPKFGLGESLNAAVAGSIFLFHYRSKSEYDYRTSK